jgi:hypothetical protein
VRVKQLSFLLFLFASAFGIKAASAQEAVKVMVSCVQLDEPKTAEIASNDPDFAFFRIFVGGRDFESGEAAQKQGLYYLSDLVGKPVSCDVNGKTVEFQVLNYVTAKGHDNENYEIQVALDGTVLLHTPKAKVTCCGYEYISKFPFNGIIEVNDYGLNACAQSTHTRGHRTIWVAFDDDNSPEAKEQSARFAKERADLQGGVSPPPADEHDHYSFESYWGDIACG